MTEKDENLDFITESLFEQKFFIHKVTVENKDGEFYMVGFDPGEGASPQAVTIEAIEQLPEAMMWWVQKIMIEKLGWEPPTQNESLGLEVNKPKLIIPGTH